MGNCRYYWEKINTVVSGTIIKIQIEISPRYIKTKCLKTRNLNFIINTYEVRGRS